MHPRRPKPTASGTATLYSRSDLRSCLTHDFLLYILLYTLLTFQSKFCGDEKETTVHTRADSRRPVMLPASCGLSVPGEG